MTTDSSNQSEGRAKDGAMMSDSKDTKVVISMELAAHLRDALQTAMDIEPIKKDSERLAELEQAMEQAK